ncbi:MAG: flagellar hook-associated protein FlgL [Planctomycetes bacterium]|nr:flagellar hook-associated protein FlgL [Planctomycetota bacterium]
MERITNVSLNRTILGTTQQTLARLATYQRQLASGKKVNEVSDDPVGAKTAMRYRAEQFSAGKYLDNIDRGTAFMNASDSALAEMSTLMDQVKDLGLQGTNGTQDASSRKVLAQSVDSYLTRMIELGNSVHDGRYIFAGTATVQDQPPFARSADDASVAYSGNLDSFSIEIGPTATVPVNQNGYQLFMGEVDVFRSVIELRDALKANDGDKVNALLANVDAASVQVNDLHGAMGGRLQRLELARNQLEDNRTYLGELVSGIEDVDMTEAISQMQLSQVALEAGLQAGTRVLQPTLLDFIR